MWTAEPRRPRARARHGGYTLVETIIVVSLIVVLAMVLHGTVGATQEAEAYLQAMRTAAERGQKVALEVSSLVNVSRKMFQGDDVGNDYLDACDLGALARLAGTRLPVIVDDEVLGEDEESEPKTGNALLFVRETDPAPCVADPGTGKIRHVDTYRFVCVYPRLTTNSLVAGQPKALDLMIWKSEVYVSWAQITEIPDATQRKNVLKDLHVRYGYRHAWDVGSPVEAAFYAFDKLGNIDSTPATAFSIEEDLDVSERSRLVYARTQLARSDASAHATRTILTGDDPADWRPDGFEVKITGSSSSRQVWIHLVVEAPQAGGQRTALVPSTVIVNCQDM